MKYQIFSENQWVYPDSDITETGRAALYSARGADVCFQVLPDLTLSGGETIQVSSQGLACEAVVYQLLPACVNANSHAILGTTLDYESVKDFVTRKAPFYVYDKTLEPENGKLHPGRAAFYIRLNVALDAVPGTYCGKLSLQIGSEALELPVELKVYNAQVPRKLQSHHASHVSHHRREERRADRGRGFLRQRRQDRQLLCRTRQPLCRYRRG